MRRVQSVCTKGMRCGAPGLCPGTTAVHSSLLFAGPVTSVVPTTEALRLRQSQPGTIMRHARHRTAHDQAFH